ncbi:hypothetical protein [Enterovirga aerilata]|uniref:Secreted protein n=1 Tax=Enterovirga aerilata TaxID=2730920 RepID=A0A849HXP5_9HYPH|nr:hypothetical protein [Enterovirga sp. DB1703]NNM72306.1 hypothetical protein [Enterovirga sp. DB1703]
MRRRFAMLGLVASVLGGATLLDMPAVVSGEAPLSATFVIPADDSYGVAECTTPACGKVVADQWCAAQGYTRAITFGEADPTEVTGSIKARLARSSLPENRPISITCGR